MKGRKPKYPQEEKNRVAERLAAGESASAISEDTGWPRTSVLRCADSPRIPQKAAEQIKQSIKDRNAERRERLFWRFVESNMRQGIAKSASAAPKEVAAMLEAAVKLRALMATSGAAQRNFLLKTTDETIMKFSRFIKGEVVAPAAEAEVQEVGLGEAKGDDSGNEPEARPGEQNGG